MRRLIAVAIVALASACQAVTGDFSVGAGGHDSGEASHDGEAVGDSPDGTDAADAATDSTTIKDAATDSPGDVTVVEAEAGPACVTDLSNVGTGDFDVSFTVVTTAQTGMALVSQRATCLPYSGWDIYTSPTGAIEIETDDGVAADRVFQIGGGPVNDGKPHYVEAARVAGKIWVQTDNGVKSPLVADTNALADLPPLIVGSDPGGVSPNGCGSGVIEPLAGSLTNLCVTKAGGPGIAADAGTTCLTDLSGVGTADFHIAFTLTTTAGSIDMALLNQRTGCDETTTWWDVSYIPSTSTTGGLAVATDDGTHYVIAEQATGAVVDDGKPHHIVVARVGGQLGFSVDGLTAAGPIPNAYSFGAMPPLRVGTDDCAGFAPTIGSITDVCITTP
jgi:hypothetical protein